MSHRYNVWTETGIHSFIIGQLIVKREQSGELSMTMETKPLKDTPIYNHLDKLIPPVKLPQYRLLNEGEIIKENDEIYDTDFEMAWKPVAVCQGLRWQPKFLNPVRRLIPDNLASPL